MYTSLGFTKNQLYLEILWVIHPPPPVPIPFRVIMLRVFFSLCSLACYEQVWNCRGATMDPLIKRSNTYLLNGDWSHAPNGFLSGATRRATTIRSPFKGSNDFTTVISMYRRLDICYVTWPVFGLGGVLKTEFEKCNVAEQKNVFHYTDSLRSFVSFS